METTNNHRVLQWTPPSGQNAQLQPAGTSWDVVRVPLSIGIGERALDLLGATTGAAIENPIDRVLYWLIKPGAAVAWDMSLLPAVQVWGATAYIEVPPVARTTGPGVRWRVPLRYGRHLTDPTVLLAALKIATSAALGPREGARR
ncbi:hypothetical protein B7755_022480 [Streptomyces sp. NBS 14/10]|uniref:hypothetical protein n=1 Tax=Streptomyces sp. NBS 14/10 TaxID=1945643 RepID=UPI000B7ECBEE|nr:hypothetical protein [Streptomyces sp. NBS 14/10]KAK1180665.1 hypothetical protein B7755_022480 [Streptomyces sp. NBS 14/10]